MTNQINGKDSAPHIMWSTDLAKKLKEERKKRPHLAVKSGIDKLDDLIDGFRGGEVTVISGPTGNGKTELCRTFTHNFVKNGILPVWFTFEEMEEEFLEKFGEPLPEFPMPEQIESAKIPWIEACIREAEKLCGEVDDRRIGAIFIDHLHYLIDMGSPHSKSLEIGFIMRQLKLMAKELDMAVFLVAHVTKIEPKDRSDTMETESLRDSSFIGQEANNVIFIKRMGEDGSTEAQIKITKNRRKGVMKAYVTVWKDGSYLTDRSRGEQRKLGV